ncbi:MAG: DUF501 domain-containing protein [Firmicutes bacterium]|nr:DUF501 domain-containing protein [Bacillota bacterium]MDD4263783.1 DUF501 domain-containing protein [Bacillota bacterium]MDD4693773.1 DUF501 domain-containing protein [Bacillota bacterium]
MDERVTSQLGRRPQGDYEIHELCPWGYPLVLKTHPYLGAISPTLYWLSCPYLVRFVSKLEAEGLVSKYDKRLKEDPVFQSALDKAHESYAKERSLLIEESAFLDENIIEKLKTSGIGGSENREGVKCLHMHLAHFLATGQNPIGKEVWEEALPWKAKECPSNCPPVPSRDPKPLAVIDAGSNTCRLLIAGVYPEPLKSPIINVNKGHWQGIYTETTTTEAGRDIREGKKKTAQAVERYLSLIEAAGAKLVRGVATGIWRKEGLPEGSLEVISGLDEAKYSFLGACSSLQLKGDVTVCDLGGSSLEIISGTDGSIKERDSFELGFWSVFKALGINESKLSSKEILEVREYVKKALGHIPLKGQLVFIGGTATTLAGLQLGLNEYDSSKIHGYRLDLSTVSIGWLPRWAKERESSIELGAQILKAILELNGDSYAIVSDMGLMAGILSK